MTALEGRTKCAYSELERLLDRIQLFNDDDDDDDDDGK
jgi:hypothetical protein